VKNPTSGEKHPTNGKKNPMNGEKDPMNSIKNRTLDFKISSLFADNFKVIKKRQIKNNIIKIIIQKILFCGQTAFNRTVNVHLHRTVDSQAARRCKNNVTSVVF
jgi:ribosomal protein L15